MSTVFVDIVDSIAALSREIISEHGQRKPIFASLVAVGHSLLLKPGQRYADIVPGHSSFTSYESERNVSPVKVRHRAQRLLLSSAG